MTDTDKALKRIEALLTRLVEKFNPEPVKPKVPSETAVSGMLKQFGRITSVTENDDADIPSQLSDDERDSLRFQQRPRRRTPGRSDTKAFRTDDQ